MAAPASANKGIPIRSNIKSTAAIAIQSVQRATFRRHAGLNGGIAQFIQGGNYSGSFESGGVTDSNPMAAW